MQQKQNEPGALVAVLKDTDLAPNTQRVSVISATDAAVSGSAAACLLFIKQALLFLLFSFADMRVYYRYFCPRVNTLPYHVL